MSYRYRLYPNAYQAVVLNRHCSHARFVWNLALEQEFHARSLGRYADQGAWDRQLAEARQAFPWLAEGSSMVQKNALRDLRQAFRNWWRNPQSFHHPKWRKARANEGFCITTLVVRKINRKWAEVAIPKAGRLRFRLSRSMPPDPRSARVTRDGRGRWHVSLVGTQPGFRRSPTSSAVALDMGIATMVTLSNGDRLQMPNLLTSGENQRKRRLQRQMARQNTGSARLQRTKRSFATLCLREAARHKDWIEKTTTDLVRSYDLIALEDLKVKQMMRSARGTVGSPGKNVAQKRGLNRGIQSQGWGMFRRRLTDKANAAALPDGTPAPVQVIAVNPAFTSQRCSSCGHTTPENRESQAVFRCRACNYEDNADLNAAKNILAAGLAVTGRGGTSQSDEQRPGTL